jgi:DNA polymerase II small subunit/DNA polymerase delta subunit B
MVFVNESEIIGMFLKKGYMLDKESLKFFVKNTDKIDSFLEKISSKKTHKTITLNIVNETLEPETGKPKIEILEAPKKEVKKFSVEEVTHFFNSRYEKIRKMFSGRLDLINPISINKISPNTKKFTIIAMITEKNEGDFSASVEDQTGNIEVFFAEPDQFKQLVIDEVVGLLCESQNGIHKAEKIIWPDVPLNKEVNKGKEDCYCLFLSDLHLDNPKHQEKHYQNMKKWLEKKDYDISYVFILGGISSKKEDVISFLNDLPIDATKILAEKSNDFAELETNNSIFLVDYPSLLQVDNIKILLVNGEYLKKYKNTYNSDTSTTLLNLFKKRHLDPTFEPEESFTSENVLLLDKIPDIVACGTTGEPSLQNYKGTTIISTGNFMTEPIYWLINLRTRETFKIDFS